MNRLIAIRAWLQQNKVFFEVSAAILIGGASLIVSCSALRVSEKTLAATEIATMPHFALSKRGRTDPASGKFVEETLVLNNHGAPAYNVSWTIRTFLVFDRYSPSPARSHVPLVGYYFALYPTASPTGELSSAVGHENLRKFSALYGDALERKVEDAAYSSFPTLLTLSFVNYEDRLGRVSTVYFRDYAKVGESDVKDLLELAERFRGIDIDTTTLHEALAAAKSPDALSVSLLKR